jgi:chloramphenicol-sensitive protein RarD
LSIRTKGIISAVSVFLLWGLTPLYWSRLGDVAALEIMAHRVWWSFPLMWLIILARDRNRGVSPKRLFADRRTLAWAAGAAVLVAGNWLIYVWAVSRGRTLDASLGYYINPLVNVALGTIVLKERLDGMQKLALGIAAAGVAYLTVFLGSFPWISIALALSFGTYGLIKKQIPIGSIDSLGLEITLITPFALAYIIWREAAGGAFFGGSTLETALLLGAGAITVFPLLLFGYATRAIRLTDVGFIQYIAPTMMLLIGVFVLEESFDPRRMPGFVLVWIALVFYTISVTRQGRRTIERRTPGPTYE